MKNDELDTNVKSKLELNITKEDVLEVLIVEKEQEYKRELEIIYGVLDNNEKELEASEAKLRSIIINKHKLKEEDAFSMLTNDYSAEAKVDIIQYDMARLSTIKRPDLARKKRVTVQHNMLTISSQINVKRKVEQDGFCGQLIKTIEMSILSKPLQKELAKYNDVYIRGKQLLADQSGVEYKILILEHDRSIKSNLVKKIVNASDVSLLLLGESTKKD